MKCLAALLVLAPSALAQTTWHVDVNGTPPGAGTLQDPYTSIQYAIDQPTTVDLDTLLVAPGTYVENVDFGSKALRLVGAGPELCTIRAAGPGRVVEMLFGGDLRGFTITGGHGAPEAAGVYVGMLFYGDIDRCVITGNAGRGLYYRATSGSGNVRHCTISGNGKEGLYMSHGAGGHFQNTIVWGNALPPVLSFAGHSQGSFWHNAIESSPFKNACWTGLTCGNFSWDPMFEDAAGGDYSLRLGSPCVDAGDPYSPPDPDGSPADVGAQVFDPQASPGPSVYCTSKVNSQGCTPAIGFTGAPSASGAPFDITCSNVINNKLGLLFYGYQSKALPYQEGTLCVTAPVKRTSLQNAGGNPPPDDCSGQYTYDFDARIQSGIDPNLVPGALVYTQFWYRDSQHPGAFTTGRSDALAFLVLP